MKQEFNEQESLRLITETINQVRNDLQKGGGDLMILWGYGIAVIALLNFAAIQIFGEDNNLIYTLWTLCTPLYIASALIRRRKNMESLIKNRIGNMISDIWKAHLISTLAVVISFFTIALGLKAGIFFILINPVIIIITGLALFATGKICTFKPFVYGGFICWSGAILSALLTSILHRHSFDFIVLALCMIFGLIIPGHILNSKHKQNV